VCPQLIPKWSKAPQLSQYWLSHAKLAK
jgi:hypothetical protein